MKKYSTFVGLDLGDRFCYVCVMDKQGNIVEETRVSTEAKALERYFGERKHSCVALETGTHSPWISRLLEGLGLRVYVANARKVRLIHKNPKKSDRLDAQILARLARLDPQLLEPVQHRSEEAQADLAVLRARDSLVQARTGLINTVRGLVKAMGARIPSCSAESFHHRATAAIPESLKPAVGALIETIQDLTSRIRAYDAQLTELCEKHSVTELLREIPGIGPVTALAFVLVIDDPHRFERSRQVGSYLGLVPRRDQSGSNDPQLRITKAGNGLVRRLLVCAAHYVLGPFGPDSALRQWGLAKAGGGNKSAKKKAVVAVARKLAVLLHMMWVTGQCYEAFPIRGVACAKAG